MKKLTSLELKEWFVAKISTPLAAASVNTDYGYEIIKETEKAIQIRIVNTKKAIKTGEWLEWIPKSAIKSEEEVVTESFGFQGIVGKEVEHKTFGKGTVIGESDNMVLTIDFNGEVKELFNSPSFIKIIK